MKKNMLKKKFFHLLILALKNQIANKNIFSGFYTFVVSLFHYK